MYFSKIIMTVALAITAASAAPTAAPTAAPGTSPVENGGLTRRDDCLWGGDYTTCLQRGESSYCLYCSNGTIASPSTCIADCNHYVQEHCTGCSS